MTKTPRLPPQDKKLSLYLKRMNFKRALPYIFISFALIIGMAAGGALVVHYNQSQFVKRIASLVGAPPAPAPLEEEAAAEPPPPPSHLQLWQLTYADLPGWQKDNQAELVPAFLLSCDYWQNMAQAGRQLTGAITGLRPQDYLPICDQLKALAINPPDPFKMRALLEENFTPYWVVKAEDPSDTGLFTGYYESELRAARTPSAIYKYPIYGKPDSLISLNLSRFSPEFKGKSILGRVEDGYFLPYYQRSEIDRGYVKDKPILYAADALDLFILHIQGSGRAELPNGEVIRLGYAANNGHKYRSIGRVLLDRGALPNNRAGWPQIRDWIKANPKAQAALLAENPRYIFFQTYKTGGAEYYGVSGPFGAIGKPLLPERALAVDPSFIPLGVPLWLDSEPPYMAGDETPARLQRLMLAQDTGGAIKGVVRGDYFWGHGKRAEKLAGRMKSKGGYAILLPKSFAVPKAIQANLTPLIPEP